jgi:uncharacterized protein (DUF1778 family)
MAIAEHEVKQEAVREISIQISREQEDTLTRAASQTGQSLEEFASSALLRAARDNAPSAAESFAQDIQWHQSIQGNKADKFQKIIGIFKDEPLMEALMERIREDRRVEIERFARETDAEG